MKTILIPTDFSDDAMHAARYAADFANHVKAERIILYTAYTMPVTTEMTWALMESETLKKASEQGIQKVRSTLVPFCDPSIEIEAISEFGFMAEQIPQLAKEKNVDIVIMGIHERNKLEQVLIGSNTLTVIQHTDIPVLVIPPGAQWQPVEQIAWACDYKKIEATTPISAIKEVLKKTGAKLHVVHNETNHKDYDPALLEEDIYVHETFKDQAPEYALLEGEDLTKSIDGYVKEHDIQWLISIPKEHGWWEKLFSKGHLKDLAYHTHIPMLCLKKSA